MSGKSPENSLRPQYRLDPLTNLVVILAPARGLRPHDTVVPASQGAAQLAEELDPFLEGHEDRTPPEQFAFRAADSKLNGPGWRVRVFRNGFPALEPEIGSAPVANGPAGTVSGFGVHELIVECPHFETRLARLSPQNIAEVFAAYRQRILALEQEPKRLMQPVVFKNEGAAAGASQPHCHSQLLALPFVPPLIKEKLHTAIDYHRKRRRCLMCDWLKQERDGKLRLICETAEFVALCPGASRHAYETCIVPRRHSSHFATITPEQLEDLSHLVKDLLTRLEQLNDDFAYNYVIQTAPYPTRELPDYHWHLEILPRMTGLGGFELGTGMFLNTLSPEEAAKRLREAH